jgi:hypothetical protein
MGLWGANTGYLERERYDKGLVSGGSRSLSDLRPHYPPPTPNNYMTESQTA